MSNLEDHGIQDIIQLYTLGKVHVTTMGSLGMKQASYLNYTRKKNLTPFGLMDVGIRKRVAPAEGAVTAAEVKAEVEADSQDGGQLLMPAIKEEEHKVD